MGTCPIRRNSHPPTKGSSSRAAQEEPLLCRVPLLPLGASAARGTLLRPRVGCISGWTAPRRVPTYGARQLRRRRSSPSSRSLRFVNSPASKKVPLHLGQDSSQISG
jgi:hypothetical protein